ncbi:MAG: glycosyltransferase [Candidatus Kerfeldbacteria bacterium]|nr:glycosyltransferase [Candidatus Kerfeldbacteria bacterium]
MKKECQAFPYQPRLSILTPVYNVAPKLLFACVDSMIRQYYQNWEMCVVDDGSSRPETVEALKKVAGLDMRITVKFSPKNGGISAATNQALEMATGEFIGLLDHDDELTPDALYENAKLLNEHPEADFMYSDEDKLGLDGTPSDPFFKPDWSPEYFLSCMYTCHFGVYRTSLVRKVGGFRSSYDKAQDYDLVLRIIDQTKHIYHIPEILYHWRKIPGSTATALQEKDMSDAPATRALRDYVQRNTLNAEVELDPNTTYHRIRYAIQDNPKVSILIPTNGKIVTTEDGRMINLLVNCLKSIEEKTTYTNYEIIVAHNGNLTQETQDFIEKRAKETGRYIILHYVYHEPFNFANKLNFIAKHATGEYLLILNDDIEVLTPEWMTAMLEYAQLPDIGVVGAKLYYPNGLLQHVGVVMGIGGGASHVFVKRPKDEPGYFSSAKVIRNYSVVTGACCLTKRALFENLGGFDEQFAIDYNDVDYNLRVRAKGYRVVFTPYAELIHYESISLGSRAGKTERPEEKLLRTRWAKVIQRDPYYNPHLTLQDTNYQIRL